MSNPSLDSSIVENSKFSPECSSIDEGEKGGVMIASEDTGQSEKNSSNSVWVKREGLESVEEPDAARFPSERKPVWGKHDEEKSKKIPTNNSLCIMKISPRKILPKQIRILRVHPHFDRQLFVGRPLHPGPPVETNIGISHHMSQSEVKMAGALSGATVDDDLFILR